MVGESSFDSAQVDTDSAQDDTDSAQGDTDSAQGDTESGHCDTAGLDDFFLRGAVPPTASFRDRPATKAGTFRAAIVIFAPVFGLRPSRA